MIIKGHEGSEGVFMGLFFVVWGLRVIMQI